MGQVQTMRSSYTGILLGLGLAVILVYMLIVVNFQSWLDPFIIITALSGRADRHRGILISDAYHVERAGSDGGSHVHGNCHRQ